MDNKELKDKVKFKIAMSEIYKEEDLKLKKNNIYNKLATVACFIILVSVATFADAISEKVYDIYNYRKQYYIETKLPEKVINDKEKLNEVLSNQNSIIEWSENSADTIECDNLEVDITEVHMNDYYITFFTSINFTEDITKKMPLKDIYLVRFPDLVIKDENDNILFCMEENKLKEIFKTDDLESIRNNPKYCISEVTRYCFENYTKLGSNPNIMVYYLNTRLPSIYPKSKKLTFEFTKIALDTPEASYGIDNKHYLHQDQTLTILGNWSIDIDVPQKYYDREAIIPYKLVQSDSNPKNELLYCYYKDGLMHAEFALSSEETSGGPWGAIKIGDMLTALNLEPIVNDYIMYKLCSSDDYKQSEVEREKSYNIDSFYIENSNGVKSKERGLMKRERRQNDSSF